MNFIWEKTKASNQVQKILHIDDLVKATDAIVNTKDATRLSAMFDWLLDYCLLINFSYLYSGPLIRGRVCPENGYESFQNMQEPPLEASKHGRVNSADAPLLYTGQGFPVVASEIGLNSGTYAQFMSYRIKPGLSCCFVGEVARAAHGCRSFFNGKNLNEVYAMLQCIPHKGLGSLLFADAFLGEILGDRNAHMSGYVHSRSLASALFKKLPHVQAVIYPSVALEGGTNVAIQPVAARQFLAPIDCHVHRIDKVYKYGIFDSTIVRSAARQSVTGDFIWQQKPAELVEGGPPKTWWQRLQRKLGRRCARCGTKAVPGLYGCHMCGTPFPTV